MREEEIICSGYFAMTKFSILYWNHKTFGGTAGYNVGGVSLLKVILHHFFLEKPLCSIISYSHVKVSDTYKGVFMPVH